MPKTIMVIDDSASMRQMVSFTLKEAGYDVLEAIDGVDALEKIPGASIDLFLTDMNMPNMNGIELIKKIRDIPSHKYAPILFLTTVSQVEKKKEAKQAGATGWIVKPFKSKELVDVIKKVIK